MSDQQREIVRDNYNAVAQRVAAEWAALHPNYAFDPMQLAHHTNALIDELKRQRDEAVERWNQLHADDYFLLQSATVYDYNRHGIVAFQSDYVPAALAKRLADERRECVVMVSPAPDAALRTIGRIAAANGEERRE